MNGPKSHAGLCEGCRHSRVIRTARSAFWMCGRSAQDPEYPRYPRLPVLRCNGFEPLPEGESPAEGPPPRA